MEFQYTSIVTYLLYALGLLSVLGIWLSLGSGYSKVKARMKMTQKVKEKNVSSRLLNYKWFRYYHFLLATNFKDYTTQHFTKVIIAHVIAFIGFSLVTWLALQDMMTVLFFSFAFTIVFPVTALYFLFKRKEQEIQESLVETAIRLLQEYEKSHRHMLYALKDTIGSLEGVNKVVFSKIYARMHDDDETKVLATELLAFQIGHFRGKNLATIILKGVRDGVDVTPLLEHLVEDITGFNKRTRDARTEARETALIGYFILPALIGLYFVCDIWLIPDGKTFYYQFQTAQGLQSFLFALLFGVVGIGLAIIVGKPKAQ